jgi:type II secretion system protein G
MKAFKSERLAGFTLIELLIVVAIIAILAAIAVPNFLEAQTRAKVSRCAADMRSLRTGLEAYAVDNQKYPETDYGAGVFDGMAGAGMDRLSTPIAYMSSIPKSPFKEDKIGQNNGPANRHCTVRGCFLYVSALRPTSPIANGYNSPAGLPNTYDQSYQTDRVVYRMSNGGSLAEQFDEKTKGFWEIKSVGPNNIDDFDQTQTGEPSTNARSYDATNGTASKGDVVVFSDTAGFAHK